MRKTIAILVASFALTVGASTASAATWPAHCHSFRCVNAHLNAVNTRLNQQRSIVLDHEQRIGNLESVIGCLFDFPMTVAGDGSLHLTVTGNFPTAWLVYDQCNTAPAAATKTPPRLLR